MTKWNEFTAEQKSAITSAISTKCMTAAGVTDATKKTAIETVIGSVIEGFADVRCVYDLTDSTISEIAIGIAYIGNPFVPQIVGIIRNTGTGANLIPEYGRKTESESVNKSGTEQVAMKPAALSTLDEKITIAVPDIRAATKGSTTATDVDAAEKMRFDSEAEKILAVLFGRWIRRASFPGDL